MARNKRVLQVGAGVAAVAVLAVGAKATGESGDDLHLLMENAAGLQKGTPVYTQGLPAGSVTSVDLVDNQARVGLDLDEDELPLRKGTRAVVRWKSVLGQRVIELTPGQRNEPELARGADLLVSHEQVDVDEVLAALDPKTRRHLSGMLKGLNGAVSPASADLNKTLAVSGPALEQLGKVLDAAGKDAQAIREIVTQLDRLVGPLAERDTALARSVEDVTAFADSLAEQERGLSAGLRELPRTLDAAGRTFRAVPPAAREARPLLRDLRPVSSQLASVSQRLAPVLVDLRPAMARLRPVLGEVDHLLDQTPGLMDSAHGVVPGMDATINALVPAVTFLRPYTPDLVGWLSNWASGYAYYDAGGHYAAAVIRNGPQAFDENPGVPLSVDFDPAPAPGTAGRTPWTDANGSTMR